ncbi:hypothetical protein HPP92_024336 [Vanilla planifolia]|uniref:Uncharacterized protein n=1 Tax=Vanilla planifolia TaxID=51239 RepID=A0A835PKN7_VANPL|nr:hypothetical protein HPP92_024336 [Vanilla planifolia]
MLKRRMSTPSSSDAGATGAATHHLRWFTSHSVNDFKNPLRGLNERAASSLLDRYEIEHIAGELDRLLLRTATVKKNSNGAVATETRGIRSFLSRKVAVICSADEGSVVLAGTRSGGAAGKLTRGKC